MADINVSNEIIDVTINESFEINVSNNYTNVTINDDLEVNITNQVIEVSANEQLAINTTAPIIDISVNNNGVTIEAPNGAYPFPISFKWFDYVSGKTSVVETSVSGGIVQTLSYSGTSDKRYRFIGTTYDSATDIIYKSFVGGILTEPVAQKLITL
jgi:hypothetical protein